MIKSIRIVFLCAGVVGAILLTIGADALADTYTYDAFGRLVGVTYNNGSTVTYTYDATGNRTAVSQTP